ncbi:trimethylamine methyltransferase family protein, partial [bacterium]|nr:trimethylamine methyltransferase family protein [candidate division CSSED10-310 bacterium]
MPDSRKEIITPRLELLSTEQINQLHRYSVRILEKTGIRVESKSAREIFMKSGSVRIRDEIVLIQGELIDSALKSVPSCVTVYNRSGEAVFELGEKQSRNTYFGFGGTNTHYEDIESGGILPFTRKHMRISSRLTNLLPNYDFISTIGVPSDVPADKADLYATLEMAANTRKPLVLLILEDKNMGPAFELLTHLFGDISTKPF